MIHKGCRIQDERNRMTARRAFVTPARSFPFLLAQAPETVGFSGEQA